MQNITKESFGLVIAYVLPGYFVILGMPDHILSMSEVVCTPTAATTVGSFLSTSVVALSFGMLISALRWLTIDSIHWLMGIRPKGIRFRQLRESLEPFLMLVEEHYRYYQFYSNGLLSVCLLIVLRGADGSLTLLQLAVAGSILTLLFLASRDTLKKYYERTEALLQDDEQRIRLHLP